MWTVSTCTLFFVMLLHGSLYFAKCETLQVCSESDQYFPSCLTLSQFAKNSINLTRSNTTLLFIGENHTHYLTKGILVSNVIEFSMTSTSKAIINCHEGTNLTFFNVSEVYIRNLTFIGCGGNTIDSVDLLQIDYSHFHGKNNTATSILIIESNTNLTDTHFLSNVYGSYRSDGEYFRLINFSDPSYRAFFALVGGALIISHSTLNIDNCLFERNAANIGGAIFSEFESNITIRNSNFISNQATGCNDPRFCIGGALFIEGTSKMSVFNSCFQNNTSDENGGIAYVFNATFIILKSNISNNIADSDGGVVTADQSSYLKFKSTRFNGNRARHDGGAMYLRASKVMVSDCHFTQNVADGNGGAIVNQEGSTVMINSSNFTFSDAGSDGGVLINQEFSNTTVFNSIFSYSTAKKDGGVMHTINGCKFIQCIFFGNSAANMGGVLYAHKSRSTIHIQSSRFHNNSAFKGGVLTVRKKTNIIVNDSTFYSNTKMDNGGVLYAYEGTDIVLTNSNFSNNSALYGGVLNAKKDSHISMENCTLSSNMALSSGGAIYARTSCTVVITNTNFIENRAIDDGIMLISDSSNMTIEYCIFEDNVAGHDGGAIHVYDDSNILVDCCTFNRNRAGNSGGAIYARNNGSITVYDSSMERNLAQNSGGGIHAQKNCRVIIETSDFAHNTADYGGVVHAYVFSTVDISTSNFMKNLASIAGGALATYESSDITVVQCHFTFNTAGTGAVSIAFQNTYKFKCLLKHCDNIKVKKSMVTFNESSFRNNRAQKSGVHYIQGSTMNVRNCYFYDNFAGFFGGGIFATRDSIVGIYATNFTDNVAMYNGGALALTSNTTVNITCANFIRNRAHNDGGVVYMRWANASIYSTRFSSSSSDNNGGVIAVVNGSVEIECSCFDNNNGTHEGGVFHTSSNSHLTITSSNFINNVASSGGVLHQKGTSNCIVVHCFFLLNRATCSGGALSSLSSFITITYSNFKNNSANKGAALALVEKRSALFLAEVNTKTHTILLFDNVCKCGAYCINGSSSNPYLRTETIFSHNLANETGGALFIDNSIVTIRGSVYIGNNQATSGGGIYAVESSIMFGGLVHFHENWTKETGGGISLTKSKFYDNNESARIKFESNRADVYGGGIYVYDESGSSVCANNPASRDSEFSNESGCFFQYIMTKNLMMIFIANHAIIRGDDLFGGLLDRCTVVSNARPFELKPSGTSLFKEISNLASYDTISSKPVKLCLCMHKKNNTMEPDCSQRRHKVRIKMKNDLPISIAAVDQVNHTIAATILSKFNDNINLTESETIKRIGPECHKLKYRISFPSIKKYELHLYPKGLCADKSISKLKISVDVVSCTCPPGFMQEDTDTRCVCVCDQTLSKYINECDKKTESVIRKGTFWITYLNTSSANNVNPYFIYPYCPLNYCQSPKKPIQINFNQPNGSDAQCANNRGGFLCGSCLPHYSLSFGSTRCISCPKNWYGLVIGIILGALIAGLVLVFLILVLNLTVAVGTLNSLIFYANIIYANKSIYFGQSQLKFFPTFISWLNLNIGVDVCFFEGMDSYAKVWLELAFPIYIIMLVIVIICISSRSSQFSKLLGKKNPVATLATLILLSYTKLLEAMIVSFSFITLTYPDGTVATKWLLDASVDFNAWKYSALIFIGILVLIIGLFYTALILFWQLLLRCPRKAFFKFTRNQKLHSFVEVYHIPYTARHRYWTGLLLLVRIIVYLISTFTVSVDPRISLLSTAVIVTSLLLYKTLFMIKVYKNWLHNAIESFTHFNIVMFAMLTWYAFDNAGDENENLEKSTTYISVGINFVLFLLVIIFHAYRYGNSKVYSFGKNLKLVKKVRESWITSHRNDTDNYHLFDFIDTNREIEYTPPPVHLQQGISKSVVSMTDSEYQMTERNYAREQLED